jgi:hypothetical protein
VFLGQSSHASDNELGGQHVRRAADRAPTPLTTGLLAKEFPFDRAIVWLEGVWLEETLHYLGLWRARPPASALSPPSDLAMQLAGGFALRPSGLGLGPPPGDAPGFDPKGRRRADSPPSRSPRVPRDEILVSSGLLIPGGIPPPSRRPWAGGVRDGRGTTLRAGTGI